MLTKVLQAREKHKNDIYENYSVTKISISQLSFLYDYNQHFPDQLLHLSC